jgi:hypothetical protein
MFWLVSGLFTMAMVFVKLGAYSVWIIVFKWLLTIVTMVSGIALAGYLIKKVFL